MKINRSPNRLEKLIQAEIKRECSHRTVRFWGSDCLIEPAFVDTGRGDRKQLVYVQPLDTRPDYYVLRIDSKEDIEADGYEWDENLLCPIEETYDNVDRYECYWDDKMRWMGKEKWYDNEPPIEIKWPMLHWSGGSWGVIKNFG